MVLNTLQPPLYFCTYNLKLLFYEYERFYSIIKLMVFTDNDYCI